MNIAAYGFAIWETFYVTVLSTAFALVLGLPLGVLLVTSGKNISISRAARSSAACGCAAGSR